MHWTATLGILFALPSPGNMWNKPFITGKADNKSEQYSKWLEEKMCGSSIYFTSYIKRERDWVCNPHLWIVMALLWVANFFFNFYLLFCFFPLGTFLEPKKMTAQAIVLALHIKIRDFQPWIGMKITH